MQRIQPIISRAQEELATLIARAMGTRDLTPGLYQRYLSMQYHLTRGVQRYFITAAAHRSLAKRRPLRKFLFEFANEEELHYIVAGNDLHKLGLDLLAEPFDVTLWHTYFEKIVVTRPFIRLGAACVLENISAGAARALVREALAAPFLTRDNTKFLVLHQHETLPHGEQIIAALSGASLEGTQIHDVLLGARQGTVMYLRMAEWALNPDSISTLSDTEYVECEGTEKQLIESFRMEDLD